MRLLDLVLEKVPPRIVLSLFLVLTCTRFGGFFLLPPGNISPFWPVNALLFSAVILMRRREKQLTLLLALPTYVLAEQWIGNPLINAVIYSFANIAEVAVLLWLLRITATRSLVFDNINDLLVLLSLALLASAVGGGIAAVEVMLSGGDFWCVFLQWGFADYFGYCLFVPLVHTWGQWRQVIPPDQPARIREFALLLVVLLSVSVFSFGNRILGFSAPLGALFLPMPVLIWAALRFGLPGGAFATIIVACAAFFSATHGAGFFAAGTPEESVESLQLFFASLVVSVMIIASLNAERKRSFDALTQEVIERRQAEWAFRESEAQYRSIVETATEGVWLLGSDLLTIFVNARMSQMLGYSPEEMIGRPATDFMVVEDIPDHHQRMVHRQSGISENYERRFLHKDGHVLWAVISAAPVFDEMRHFNGALGMLTDITERKRTEQEIFLMNFALNNVHEAAFLIDEQGGFRFVNEESCRVLGYSRPELLTMGVIDVDPDFPAERWSEHWRELKTRRSLWIEGRHKTKDGHIFPVEISANYFQYDQQEYNMALVRDITERKRVEEELRRYKDELENTVMLRTGELRLARDAAEAANKAKSLFLANMSHELRTPLNAIIGFSRMLCRDSQLTDKQRDNLDIIIRSGEHLLTLINDVLEIAKIEAGKLQLEIRPFDLSAVAHEVSDMMQVRAKERGLQLRLDIVSEFPRYIKGDEARMRQILVNLVGNAVKFTEQGGLIVRVCTRQNDHEHLLIEVEDSGPGISAENLKRLFKPFVQLAEGSEQNGTGLGLTITQQFVKMMGGSISVESALGKGSLFRVELPLELADSFEAHKPEPKARREIAGLAPGQPRYRILIAEDQHENRLLLSQLMTGIGVEVKLAEDGERCLQIYQEWRPDLIWMDRRMPIMDGEEATRRIRSLPDGDKVKIVAVTASAFKEDQQELMAAGMDDFVRKPYHFDEIYDCLVRQLGVEYIYHEAVSTEAGPEAVLEAEMLAGLPVSLRQYLREALVTLDPERISMVIGQIAERDTLLGQVLVRFVENFDYPAILKALDKADGNSCE